MEGHVIAEKYQLIRLLGQGGMGAVYEGRNIQTYKRCAVKVLLSPELGKHEQVVKRFFREARASSVIESDHIVTIYDSGADPATGFPFMVMELLTGEDLENTIKRFGPLHPVIAAKVALQAATGLAKAHEGHIVHRDIKPANLYLTRRDNGEIVVKLLDFGIAKVKMENFSETSQGLTRTGSMLGTPLYMSPEQARGAADIDARSDVWSLGVVMYEILSGMLPYAETGSLGELMVSIITSDIPLLQDKAPWVPPELAEITHRAMSRDINRRFQNAGELRDALLSIMPDGSRVSVDQMAGVPPDQRQFIAPRLQMTDDGMLRATTRTGLSLTQTGGDPGGPRKKSSTPLVAALAGVVVLGLVGALAVSMSRNNTPAAAASAPQVVVLKSEPAAQPQDPVIKSFDLIFEPQEAEIQVDGKPATAVGGKIALSGPPGSTHDVRLSLEGVDKTQTVAITATGLIPPRLTLEMPKKGQPVVASRRGGAPAKAGGGQPAAAPAGEAAKPPPKKSDIAKDTSEFQ